MVDRFHIPWEKFPVPESLMQCLEREKLPSQKLHIERIWIVVSELMKFWASPEKQASTEVSKYPQPLQDVKKGVVIGAGNHSLAKQFQAQGDNVKQSSAQRVKKPKQMNQMNMTEKVPDEQRVAFKWTHGCINLDMKFMPVSETPQSQQEEKKK